MKKLIIISFCALTLLVLAGCTKQTSSTACPIETGSVACGTASGS